MEEIFEFYKCSDKIKRYGFVYKGYFDKDAFSSLLNVYRLEIPEKKIVVTLQESDFSQEICVSYSDLLESRYLRINIIQEDFAKSVRTTQERYGMVYQIEPTENLSIIKEVLEHIDKDLAFNNKITKGFDLVFEKVFNGFHLFGLLKRKILQGDNKLIKAKAIERIKRLRNNKVKIELYDNCKLDFNGQMITLDDIKNKIENSKEYKTKQNDIKDFMNYEISIEIENEELYLSFKELKIIDKIKDLMK